MQEEWPSTPDERFVDIMKALGKRWKEHKSNLHRRYILSESEDDPCAKYHIPQHVWDEFVRNCNTPEYKVYHL